MKTIILTRKLVSGDQIIKMHKINFTRKLTFGHIFMGLVIIFSCPVYINLLIAGIGGIHGLAR